MTMSLEVKMPELKNTNKVRNIKFFKNKCSDLATQLVAWNSETGSIGEAEFADKLISLIKTIPYFSQNPQNVIKTPSHGNPLTYNVLALVRGTGRDTLILAGHFDTVSIENYHELKSLACESEKLAYALIETLSTKQRSEQEECAYQDLLTGNFLPGRGMLDMKSGLAAGMKCIEDFLANPDRVGNIIFVATPDEERESRGMRSLRASLSHFVKENDLDIVGAVNIDVTSDQGDGKDGRAIYAGTIGKLLPFAFVIGCSSHASYPYEGVSALAMGAKILSYFEANAALADKDKEDVSPSPICLEARDLRESYEVTTPERFWLAFNWLYHSITAETLFDRFRKAVESCVTEAIQDFKEQAEKFSAMVNKKSGALPPKPVIMDYATLVRHAKDITGDSFDILYKNKQAELDHIDNPLTVSRLLTDWLVNLAKVSGPMVVIGFAGLHYPSSHLDPSIRKDKNFFDAINRASEPYQNILDQVLVWKPYFQGISDMSFLGQKANKNALIASNTPITRLQDIPPEQSLSFPVVNIGPWGREFHQKLERVYAPYAFNQLPELLLRISKEILK